MALPQPPDQCLELSEDEDGNISLTVKPYHQKKRAQAPTSPSSTPASVTTLTPAPRPAHAHALGTATAKSTAEQDQPKALTSTPQKENQVRIDLLLEIASLKIALGKMEKDYNNMQLINAELQQTIIQHNEVDVPLMHQQLQDEKNALQKARTEITSVLEQRVSCKICLEFFARAYTLYNCGHTYCADCLTDIHRTAAQKQVSPLCPECRTEIAVPPSRSYLVEELSETVKTVMKDNGDAMDY